MTNRAACPVLPSRTVKTYARTRSPVRVIAFGLIAMVPVVACAADSASRPLTVRRLCGAASDDCRFPGAASTGIAASTALRTVPQQVSSGPGWSYDRAADQVEVSGNGTVLRGLSISCDLDIRASNVTIEDIRVVTSGDFGISLRDTANVTIENSTIAGANRTTGRVDVAIDDIDGDATGTVIKDNNIYDFRTGVMLSAGLIRGNYIHSPGYISGDHTNGIYANGSDDSLNIDDNTIMIPLGQTDAITLDASGSGQTIANKTIEGNLIAGGGYSIYAGASQGNATSDIVIKDNWFSRQYYRSGGRYGPAVYFDRGGTGNVWAGNVWAGNVRAGNVRAGQAGPGATPADYRRLGPIPAP